MGWKMRRSLAVHVTYSLFIISCITPSNYACPCFLCTKHPTALFFPDLVLTCEHLEYQRTTPFTVHPYETATEKFYLEQVSFSPSHVCRSDIRESLPIVANSLTDRSSAHIRSHNLYLRYQKVDVKRIDRGKSPIHFTSASAFTINLSASQNSARHSTERNFCCRLVVFPNHDLSIMENNKCRTGTFALSDLHVSTSSVGQISYDIYLTLLTRSTLQQAWRSYGKMTKQDGFANSIVPDLFSSHRSVSFAHNVSIRLLSQEAQAGQLSACFGIPRCQKQILFLLLFEFKMVYSESSHDSLLSLPTAMCNLCYFGSPLRMLHIKLYTYRERMYKTALQFSNLEAGLPREDGYDNCFHASSGRTNTISSKAGDQTPSIDYALTSFLCIAAQMRDDRWARKSRSVTGTFHFISVHGIVQMTADPHCYTFHTFHLDIHRAWIFIPSLPNFFECVESISTFPTSYRVFDAISETVFFMIAIMASTYSITLVIDLLCIAKLTSSLKRPFLDCCIEETQNTKAIQNIYASNLAKIGIKNRFNAGHSHNRPESFPPNSTDGEKVVQRSIRGDCMPLFLMKAGNNKIRSIGLNSNMLASECHQRHFQVATMHGQKLYMRRIPPPRKFV